MITDNSNGIKALRVYKIVMNSLFTRRRGPNNTDEHDHAASSEAVLKID